MAMARSGLRLSRTGQGAGPGASHDRRTDFRRIANRASEQMRHGRTAARWLTTAVVHDFKNHRRTAQLRRRSHHSPIPAMLRTAVVDRTRGRVALGFHHRLRIQEKDTSEVRSARIMLDEERSSLFRTSTLRDDRAALPPLLCFWQRRI